MSSDAKQPTPPFPAARLRVWGVASSLLILLAAVSLSRTVPYPTQRMRQAIDFPYQLDAEEGFILAQAMRLANGEGLYGPIDQAPFVVDNYPPLYPFIWSLFVDSEARASLAAGRWVCAAASAAAALAIFCVVFAAALRSRRHASPQEPAPRGRVALLLPIVRGLLIAWTCALLFLTSYETLRWMAYTRVDMPAVALGLWGLAVFGIWGVRPEARIARACAILLFALALLTKQTLVAPPAACALWLLLRDWREGIRFILLLTAAVIVPVAILCACTGGGYWLHTVAYNQNAMHWGELVTWREHLWRFYPALFICLALLMPWALWQAMPARRQRYDRTAPTRRQRHDGAVLAGPSRDEDAALLTLYLIYFALNVLSFLTLAKAGAAENYLLEPQAAAALFLGIALCAILSRLDARPRRLGLTSWTLIVLGLLAYHGVRYSGVAPLSRFNAKLSFHSAPSPTRDAFVQGERVVWEIERRPGPILSEDPIYHLIAERPVVFQNFIMTQLTAEGKWDETPILEQVHERAFPLVVAHKDLDNAEQFFNRYSPALLSALRENYRLLDRLPRKAPLQTIYLYVPEDLAEMKGKQRMASTLARPITVNPLVFGKPVPQYMEWHEWTNEEFEQLFENMAADGITTLVLMGGNGDEVYYPSEVLKQTGDIDWYGRSLDLAERHGMGVILSGVVYTYGDLFVEGKGTWDPQADLEVNKKVFEELNALYGHHPAFEGWYIPHETGDRTHRGDIMVILRELPRFLKRLTPDRIVTYGPWFSSRITLGEEGTTPEQCAANWDSMLNEIEGIDICAFQDSTAPEEEIAEWFAAVAPVFEKHGIGLWNVVELFPRAQDRVFTDMYQSVSFDYLLPKMEATAPYTTRNACWEYQNYLNPSSGLHGATALSRDYREWLANRNTAR